MKTDRAPARIASVIGLVLMNLTPAHAGDLLDAVQERGVLRVAVYDDFAPFSEAGKGIDVDLARALAERLGVKLVIEMFDAGEDMNDDLRNMVWKGHYLRGAPADLMMHVPVDPVLVGANRQVRVFGAYFNEQIAVARDAKAIPEFHGLDAFTRLPLGVEGGTLSHDYLLSALGGRFRQNVTHYSSTQEAVRALKRGDVAAVMGLRSQLEAALGVRSDRFPVTGFAGVGLNVRDWDLGLAVRAEEERLTLALEAALEDLQRGSKLPSLFERYGVRWRPPRESPHPAPADGVGQERPVR